MGKVIFVKNNKGGVGKSTISKNLASGISLIGYKVALVSFDAQNDSLTLLGEELEELKVGLKAFIRDNKKDIKIEIREDLFYYPLETDLLTKSLKGKLMSTFNRLRKAYDYIVIDGAPSRDSFLSLAGSELADEVIVPIMLDRLSIDGISRMMKTSDYSKIRYIVPNFYNRRKTETGIYLELEEFLSDSSIYLSAPIPNSSIESNLALKGKTIFETDSKASEKIQNIYLDLIREIL